MQALSRQTSSKESAGNREPFRHTAQINPHGRRLSYHENWQSDRIDGVCAALDDEVSDQSDQDQAIDAKIPSVMRHQPTWKPCEGRDGEPTRGHQHQPPMVVSTPAQTDSEPERNRESSRVEERQGEEGFP